MRQYKDSGIEWIGEIPETWIMTEVKRLCQKITDGSHFSPQTQNEGKVYITVSNVYNDKVHVEEAAKISNKDFENLVANGCQPPVGAVLLSKDGTVGRTAIVDNNDYVVLSSLGILCPSSHVLSKYLKYLLDSESLQAQMQLAMAGSALRRITITKINNLVGLLPSLSEQQRIADYLDEKCGEIDSLIGLQEQMIEKLKAYKQSVITEAVTKGLNPKAKLVPSCIDWIGEIPEGVKLVKLSILTSKIGSGSTPRGGSTIYVKEGIKFLRSQNVYCEGFDLSDVAYITEEIDEEMNGTRVQIGDVLLNITGASIGRCYYVDETLGRANVNQHVSIIRPTKIQTKYLKYYLQSNCGQIQIALLQTGGNREGLSAAALSQFLIVYPSQDEQRSIASYLDEKCADIDRLISMKQQKIESLKDYKKSVIYEAVTGKTIIE